MKETQSSKDAKMGEIICKLCVFASSASLRFFSCKQRKLKMINSFILMSFRNKLFKLWNFWPPFFFMGIKIIEISEDNRHVVVRLKLRFWNRNYVGTQFG